jgi:hypothetical protein
LLRASGCADKAGQAGQDGAGAGDVVKVPGPGLGLGRDSLPKHRLLQQPREEAGELGGSILGPMVENQAGLPILDQFPEAGEIGDDGGALRRHGLRDGDPEGFALLRYARVAEYIHGRVTVGELLRIEFRTELAEATPEGGSEFRHERLPPGFAAAARGDARWSDNLERPVRQV